MTDRKFSDLIDMLRTLNLSDEDIIKVLRYIGMHGQEEPEPSLAKGQTDKQYDGQLIDQYTMLKRLKEIAVRENAAETVKAIENEMNVIKVKLQPTELPD